MTGLTSLPDGVDVVQTAAEASACDRPPLLVLDALERHLDDLGVEPGALAWRRIGDGQSNLTFELRRGGQRLVLRRGPRPPLPPSTHDMLREARIQSALARHGVPVPRIRAVCDDPAALGVPFYLMDYVDGDVLTTSLPAGYETPEARAATAYAAVDALADLHAVPLDDEIAALGRPDGYLARQVSRFASLWPTISRRDLPLVGELAARLADRLPVSQRASVVHGDFRLGNLMFAAPGEIAAILDWEMATLGDPLADLGYLVATYTEPGADGRGVVTSDPVASTVMDLTPVTAQPGFPTRDELVAHYAERTGLDASELAWYEALALWKAAVFCEAIRTRWLDGQRPGDTFGPRLEAGVPALLDAAAAALDEAARGHRTGPAHDPTPEGTPR